MKRFYTVKQNYSTNCYACEKVIPSGSDKIRRAVKRIYAKPQYTKNEDFHPECNKEFESVYAPIRDNWDKVESYEIE